MTWGVFRLGIIMLDVMFSFTNPCPAESGSLSYGLSFRFRLLSTSFHNDAVTFSYGVMTFPGRDFHPVEKLPRGRTIPAIPADMAAYCTNQRIVDVKLAHTGMLPRPKRFVLVSVVT